MSNIEIKHLGCVDYSLTWQNMKDFVHMADNPSDEIWFCEHNDVFTVGRQGSLEHVLNPGTIPVIQTDRGGEVTFHGPGQIVVYPLLHLSRFNLLPKQFLFALEQSVIDSLQELNISAFRVENAPGVYIQGNDRAGPFAGAKKICSIGIKISNHCTYHGLSLNFDVDLSNFYRINPCGYKGLQTVNIKDLNCDCKKEDVIKILQRHLAEKLCEKRNKTSFV